MIPDVLLSELLVAGTAAVLSWTLVGVIRRYALGRRILDVPNERSSHQRAIPRGGGLGLTAAALMVWIGSTWPGVASVAIGAAVAAIVVVLVIGWIDDRRSLGVGPRLLGQLLTGLLLLPLAMSGFATATQLAIAAGWVVIAIAAVNVVNFIDGIDGLIALQGAIFATHLALLSSGSAPAAQLGAALAGACLGFLAWNWAPARIFLGDAGSGSLAAMGLAGGILVFRAGDWPFVVVFLPLYGIFLDAALTIARRWRRGEKLTSPHRTHLYQRLANEAGWGHARVSLLYGACALTAVIMIQVSPLRGFLMVAAYVAGVTILGWLMHRNAAFQPRNPDLAKASNTGKRPSSDAG